MFRFRSGLRAITSETSGAVAVVFALCLIPVLGSIGLAVDYSRAVNAKVQLQQATDAAVLAGGSGNLQDLETLRPVIVAAFRENATDLAYLNISDDDIVPSLVNGELIVEVRGTLDTTFAAILGVDTVDIQATSGALFASGDLEVALVLDTTGSMAPFMDDLRQGATDLVEVLFSRSPAGLLKVAVVPYVGAVNIGNDGPQRSWMDLNGDAPWHAAGMEFKGMGYDLGCVQGPGGPPTDPGSGTHGSIWDLMPSFAWLKDGVFGSPALAATAGDVPHPFVFNAPCVMLAPAHINTFDLLDEMANTEWKGCVEARAEPYDVTDEAPSISNPDTLFVPWFWPDEVDSGPMAAALPGYVAVNDYIPDRLDRRNAIAPAFDDPYPGWGWANVLKYDGATATIDETGPDTLGPNKACPDPIMPLNSDQAEVNATINALGHWNGSGTNSAEGLAWGWRVLSPTVPFTEGAAYGEANKVIVLMTDGQNNIDPHTLAPVLSDYSAYGYLEQWGESRLADKTFAGFKAHTDQRFLQVCQNAKAEGIRIYTVAFGITDDATLDLLRDCATAPPMAYTAATAGELVSAFRNVASHLTQLRLSR